jgi:hypothetical protein
MPEIVTNLVKKDAAQGNPDCLVQIEVGENDEGTFSAKFQRHFLQVGLGAGRHDGVADLGAAGEAKLADLYG